jgi:hypothetical protein
MRNTTSQDEQPAEQSHWSECGRGMALARSSVLGRPHRSVLALYDYPVSTQMKKIRLSPQQNRIMWALEEAGEETARTVLATLRAEGVFVESAFAEDLAGLEHLGCVRREGDSLILTKPGYAALSK